MIDWIKRWGGWMLGAVAVLFGAGWLWSRRRYLNASARAEVAELEKTITSKRAIRDYLLTEGQQDSEAIRMLDEQIEESRRTILAHHENIEGLSRDEIRQRLAGLGYD